MLDADDRRALIAVAREAVAAAAEGREPAAPGPVSVPLQDPGAAFVTLRRGGELRGCIGHLAPGQPLWRSVQEMAAAAASRDDRFDPVSLQEVRDLRVEISVLSPRRRVAGPGDIRVGRDGLYLSRGPLSGLLLPQVATEHGWTAEDFLAQTCRKAGLPLDAWRDPEAVIETFTAEVFGEEPASGSGHPASGEDS